MKDEALTAMITAASGPGLDIRFSEIDASSGEELDALALSLGYDWWRTSWTLSHKQAIMKHAIYLGAALVSILPSVLAEGKGTADLADAVAEPLVSMYEATGAADIYGQIDSLPESLLDILALDFKIEWWDSSAPVEQKRSVFKSLYSVYRRLGTPAAVDMAVGNIYGGATIKEWFEYSGKPYHFRIDVDMGDSFPNSADEKTKAFERGIRFYKNARSVLDSVSFETKQNAPIYAGVAIAESDESDITVVNELPGAALTDEYGNILTNEEGDELVL